MKCAVIISGKIRQIMLTAESEAEQSALDLITINDEVSIEAKEGTMYDHSPKSARGYVVSKCGGGYLRAYEDSKSLMLVIQPKETPQQ